MSEDVGCRNSLLPLCSQSEKWVGFSPVKEEKRGIRPPSPRLFDWLNEHFGNEGPKAQDHLPPPWLPLLCVRILVRACVCAAVTHAPDCNVTTAKGNWLKMLTLLCYSFARRRLVLLVTRIGKWHDYFATASKAAVATVANVPALRRGKWA